ncbi:MAG: hypothetical protein ACE5MB_02620 [Anaerolineae bacterium]
MELYQTQPLVACYQERGLLTTINGEQDINGVQRDILSVVSSQ